MQPTVRSRQKLPSGVHAAPLSAPCISFCAGYFLVKPTECHECRSRDIKDTVVKTQALDYITLGKVDSALAWR